MNESIQDIKRYLSSVGYKQKYLESISNDRAIILYNLYKKLYK